MGFPTNRKKRMQLILYRARRFFEIVGLPFQHERLPGLEIGPIDPRRGGAACNLYIAWRTEDWIVTTTVLLLIPLPLFIICTSLMAWKEAKQPAGVQKEPTVPGPAALERQKKKRRSPL